MQLIVRQGPQGNEAFLRQKVQPVWDSVVLGLTNTSEIPIWATGVGGAFNTGTGSKTRHDTNLTQSGQFSAPDQFLCTGVLMDLLNLAPAAGIQVATHLSDYQRSLRDLLFQWTEGSEGRLIVEGALQMFPAPFGTEGNLAAGAVTTFAGIWGNGQRNLSNRFGFGDFFVHIAYSETFRGKLLPPTAGVTLSTTHTLRGYLTGYYGQSTG